MKAFTASTSIDAVKDYTVTATSNQTVDALVLALSVAVSGGKLGVALSGSGVYAENRVAADVLASHDGDGTGPAAGVRAPNVNFSASDTSTITADVAAATLAAAIGQTAVAISVGVSIATNTVDNHVNASIANANDGVRTTAPADLNPLTIEGISVRASESATIHALSIAASLSAAFGSTGVAVSGAGAEATNRITGWADAAVSNSPLTSAAGDEEAFFRAAFPPGDAARAAADFEIGARPDDFAGGGVERDDLFIRGRNIHHAADDCRLRLDGAGRHFETPGFLEARDIALGDLLERRIARAARIAAIGAPIDIALCAGDLRGRGQGQHHRQSRNRFHRASWHSSSHMRRVAASYAKAAWPSTRGQPPRL